MYEELETFMGDIVRYYNCDFAHFARTFLHSSISLSVHRYKECRKQNKSLETCSKQCISSTKSIKTIRLSMDIVEILMAKIPDLKVIHLLRDPRGMIKSRLKGGFVKKSMNLATIAQAHCERFERNIEIGKRLLQRYPGRLKTYLYEQIAENPKESSSSIFGFLGLTPSSTFDVWLHNHTAAGIKSSYYKTSRPNSTLTANSWRLSLPYKDVKNIDKQCLEFYKITGILPASDEKTLRNLNIPMRTYSPEFGYFL